MSSDTRTALQSWRPVTDSDRAMLERVIAEVDGVYENYVGQEGRGGARMTKRRLRDRFQSWLDEGWYPLEATDE